MHRSAHAVVHLEHQPRFAQDVDLPAPLRRELVAHGGDGRHSPAAAVVEWDFLVVGLAVAMDQPTCELGIEAGRALRIYP